MKRFIPNLFLYCLGLAILLSCTHTQESSNNPTVDTSKDYQTVLAGIRSARKSAKKAYTQASNKDIELKTAGKLLDSLIYYQIIPYWKGTAWTFTGHTDTPGQGTVACGYFVSTTLKHAGFNLNRFKLAQAASKQAGEKLVGKGNISVLTGTPTELKKYMLKNRKPGLYFLGLDFHEGYLWLTKDELYIVHSNYIQSAGVMQEKATESTALAASKSFWFAPIGGSKTLTLKWLNQTRIE